MADELVAVAEVVGLVIAMRGEDGKDRSGGGWCKFDPVTWWNMQTMTG